MAVQFPDSEFSGEPVRRGNISFFDIGFYMLAIAASGFSGFTTYLGFSFDLPKAGSAVLAFMVGLGLLLINLKIKEYKIAGERLLPPIMALFLFFVISFISNTNAIYTYFLKNDIVGDTQETAWTVFDKATTELINYANSSPESISASKREEELNIARENLYQQITDKLNPGLGELAREHLEEVEEILETKLTSLKAPGSSEPMSAHEAFADELDSLVLAQFEARNSAQASIGKYTERVKEARLYHGTNINEKNYNESETDLMKRNLETLYNEAISLFRYKGEVLEINNTADKIGSFQYTWTNFSNYIKPSAIILSVLLSVLLDLLTPALSMLLYKRDLKY